MAVTTSAAHQIYPMNLPNLNKAQRILLAVAGASIIAFQLYRFAEDGVEGIGWVFAILVGALLLLPAFGSTKIEANMPPSTESSGLTTSNDRLTKAKQRAENLTARAVAEASVLHRRLPILMDLPPLQSPEFKNINALMTDSWLQYCIAYAGCLSLMTEWKNNKSFIKSPDYSVVWQLIVNEMVKADARNAAKHGLHDKFNMEKSLEWAKRDLNEGEVAMKKFVDRLAQSIPEPDSPMVEFLMDKVGASAGMRPSLAIGVQKFTKETLQKFSIA